MHLVQHPARDQDPTLSMEDDVPGALLPKESISAENQRPEERGALGPFNPGNVRAEVAPIPVEGHEALRPLRPALIWGERRETS